MPSRAFPLGPEFESRRPNPRKGKRGETAADDSRIMKFTAKSLLVGSSSDAKTFKPHSSRRASFGFEEVRRCGCLRALGEGICLGWVVCTARMMRNLLPAIPFTRAFEDLSEKTPVKIRENRNAVA